MLAELIRRAQDENESVCDEVFEGELLTDENMSQIEFERVRFVKCRFEHCNFDHAAFITASLSIVIFQIAALSVVIGKKWRSRAARATAPV